MIISHREGQGVGQAFTHAQPLHCGQAVVQGVGIVAGSIHCKCAVASGHVCLRNETHHIVQIRIRGCGQRAADHRRVFGDGSRGRGHGGRIVAAVDAHGDNRGR